MKKTLALLLAAVMLLSMTACGGNTESAAPAESVAASEPADGAFSNQARI